MTTKFAFEPSKVTKVRALHSDVLVTGMEFTARQTSSGIIIPNDNGTGSGIRPRWGQVYAVGPEQTEVCVGQWIMVKHGRWTRGLEIEDTDGPKTIRKIDPDDIVLISDYRPQDDTMSECING